MVGGLTLLRLGIHPRTINLEVVMDVLALGQSEHFTFPQSIFILSVPPWSCVTLRWYNSFISCRGAKGLVL